MHSGLLSNSDPTSQGRGSRSKSSLIKRARRNCLSCPPQHGTRLRQPRPPGRRRTHNRLFPALFLLCSSSRVCLAWKACPSVFLRFSSSTHTFSVEKVWGKARRLGRCVLFSPITDLLSHSNSGDGCFRWDWSRIRSPARASGLQYIPRGSQSRQTSCRGLGNPYVDVAPSHTLLTTTPLADVQTRTFAIDFAHADDAVYQSLSDALAELDIGVLGMFRFLT